MFDYKELPNSHDLDAINRRSARRESLSAVRMDIVEYLQNVDAEEVSCTQISNDTGIEQYTVTAAVQKFGTYFVTHVDHSNVTVSLHPHLVD